MAKTVRGPFGDVGVRLSAAVCALGLGGFLLWSGFVPLDEGVTASGQLVVEDDRKIVQHYEGGIIRRLHVREGDRVEEGALLVELEPLQSEAARDEYAQELGVQTATLARLTALAAGEEALRLSALDALDLDPLVQEEIEARQRALFHEQRAAREAVLALLTSRRASLEGRAEDLLQEIETTARAARSASEELALRQGLLDDRLETVGNVARLERERLALEADLSRLRRERNEAFSRIEEIEKEIRETETRFAERIGEEIVSAQGRALAARERLRGTEDRLARTVVTAPRSGEVLNLEFTTIGGVVKEGEPIMEIVPDKGGLIATVRLDPTDRDAVSPGQTVKAQLTAYRSFLAPRLDGEVLGVSADLIEDPSTRRYYYEARIGLDPADLDPEARVELIPGMPVEAFIASGRSRTLLDYVTEPILAGLSRGARMG